MSVEFSVTKNSANYSALEKPAKAPSSPKIKSSFDRATRPRSPEEQAGSLINQVRKISRQEAISQDDFERGQALIESHKGVNIDKHSIRQIERDLRQGRAQTLLDQARNVTRNPANTSLEKMKKIIAELETLELEDVAPEIASEIKIIMRELQSKVLSTEESDSDIEIPQGSPINSDSEE